MSLALQSLSPLPPLLRVAVIPLVVAVAISVVVIVSVVVAAFVGAAFSVASDGCNKGQKFMTMGADNESIAAQG